MKKARFILNMRKAMVPAELNKENTMTDYKVAVIDCNGTGSLQIFTSDLDNNDPSDHRAWSFEIRNWLLANGYDESLFVVIDNDK